MPEDPILISQYKPIVWYLANPRVEKSRGYLFHPDEFRHMLHIIAHRGSVCPLQYAVTNRCENYR